MPSVPGMRMRLEAGGGGGGSSGNNQGDPAAQGLKLGSMDNYIWTGRQLKPSIYFANAIDLCK